jgi:hypothetical protein
MGPAWRPHRGPHGHLAIQPPPGHGDGEAAPTPTGPAGGARLQLAVAAAAHDRDQAATTAVIHEAAGRGLDPGELVAVAERHWPRPRLRICAWRASRRWTTARLQRLRRPWRRSVVVPEREGRP